VDEVHEEKVTTQEEKAAVESSLVSSLVDSTLASSDETDLQKMHREFAGHAARLHHNAV
jgi:hypothetical protein